MSGQSSDIKQLFSHLGLNPGDYLEIRPKPASNATRTRTEAVMPTELLMPRHPTPQEIAALLPQADRAVPAAVEPTETVALPVTSSIPEPEPKLAPVVDDLPVTLAVPAPQQAVPVARENLETLFRQVSEPSTAGASAEDLEEASSASLKDIAAEVAKDSAVSHRSAINNDTHSNEALHIALAKLKDASSRLQVPHQNVHTESHPSSESSLLDVFRRISKKY
jgi:hypothetical protein